MGDADTRVFYPAVVVAGLVAFATSLFWYSPLLFGRIWMESRGGAVASTPVWKFLVMPLRELVTALVLAHLIVRLRIFDWKRATALALSLWVAFYVVQLAGAVLWDNQPLGLSAVHAGDWLMKMVVITLVLSLWHGKRQGRRVLARP